MKNYIEPCTACGSIMHCTSVTSWSDEGLVKRYFVMCTICGYGPTQAHPCENTAIVTWNNLVFEELAELMD